MKTIYNEYDFKCPNREKIEPVKYSFNKEWIRKTEKELGWEAKDIDNMSFLDLDEYVFYLMVAIIGD